MPPRARGEAAASDPSASSSVAAGRAASDQRGPDRAGQRGPVGHQRRADQLDGALRLADRDQLAGPGQQVVVHPPGHVEQQVVRRLRRRLRPFGPLSCTTAQAPTGTADGARHSCVDAMMAAWW